MVTNSTYDAENSIMIGLSLILSSHLKDQLVHHQTKDSLHILENLEVRAKGYHQFFGPKAVPFDRDDFFCQFLLAKYQTQAFFTVKHTSLSQYQNYNLTHPLEQVLGPEGITQLEKVAPTYLRMGWCSGFTYLPLQSLGKDKSSQLAKDLSAFYLCYCLKHFSPEGLLLTANIKSKVDQHLLKCGFNYIDIGPIIHRELDNNPAKLLLLREPSDHMLDCYNKYFSLLEK